MDDIQPAPEQQQPATTNDKLRALLVAQGIELSGSDEDIAQSLSGAIRSQRELQEKLEQERVRAERLEQEYAQRLAATQKPAEQPVQKQKKWGPIEVAKELQSLVVKDKNNDVWVAKPGTGLAGAHAAEQVNAAERERTLRAERLIEDPFEAIRESGLDEYFSEQMKVVATSLEEKIRKQLEEQMTTRQQQAKQSEIEQLRNQYKGEIFVLNERGEHKLDIKGEPVLTELGKVFVDEIGDLLESGMDEVRAMKKGIEYAKSKVATVAQPESKKQEFVQQARSASVAESAARKPQSVKGETPEFRGFNFTEYVRNAPEYKQLMESKK